MILAISRLILDARFTGSIATPQAVELVGELLEQIETRLEEPDAGPVGAARSPEAPQLHPAHALGRARGGQPRSARRSASPALVERGAAVAVRAADLLDDALLGRRARRDHAGGRRAGDRRGAPARASTSASSGPRIPRAESQVLATQKALGSATACCALRRPRRLRATRRRRSRSARSGSSRRSSRSAGATRRRRCSTCCCRSATTSGSTARTSCPDTLEQSGNFPQTYSHVGLINAAFKLSRGWD